MAAHHIRPSARDQRPAARDVGRIRRPYDGLSRNGRDQNTISQITVGMPAQDRVYDALLVDHFANNR